MRLSTTLALAAFPLLGATTAVVQDDTLPGARETFQDLLDVLPDDSLQAALGSLEKFKAGVFESHRRGVQRVHDTNPPLATRLIIEAIRDLSKRQTPGNATSPDPSESQTVAAPQSSQAPPPGPTSQQPPSPTTQPPSPPPATSNKPSDPTTSNPSPPPPATSNPPDETSDAPPPPSPTSKTSTSAAPPPVIISVDVTTTRDGRVLTETTSVLSQVTASIEVTVTRVNPSGVTETATEFKPAVIRTTTEAGGRVIALTSAADPAPTKGQVLSTTNAQGRTLLTTYTPESGALKSLQLITSTTTDEEGRPSTITSYAYVDPTPDPVQAGGEEPSTTEKGKPGLQSAGAERVTGGWVAGVGVGVAGVLGLML